MDPIFINLLATIAVYLVRNPYRHCENKKNWSQVRVDLPLPPPQLLPSLQKPNEQNQIRERVRDVTATSIPGSLSSASLVEERDPLSSTTRETREIAWDRG